MKFRSIGAVLAAVLGGVLMFTEPHLGYAVSAFTVALVLAFWVLAKPTYYQPRNTRGGWGK